MKKIHDILFKYRLIMVILFFPFYSTWFYLLEKRENVDFINVHCVVDDIIPFNEIFIIPYMLWFFYVVFILAFLFLKKYYSDFYRCAAMLMTGMIISLIIYTLFPNMQTLRPETLTRDNIFTHVVLRLYSTDTCTNVCPSLHVYNSLCIHHAVIKCEFFKDKTVLKYISGILCILICMSTVFLKQHSFVDVVAALILYAILLTIFHFSGIIKEIHKK